MKSKKTTEVGLLFFRVSVALMMFLGHGWPKIQHWLSGKTIQFADPLGIGIQASFLLVLLAESLCMLAVMMGLFTRIFLIPPIVAMGVAFFWFHGHDPYYQKEPPLLFLVSFISIFLIGTGKISLQTLLKKRPLFKRRMGRFMIE